MKDNGFDLIALFEYIGRMSEILYPCNVGYMDKPVDLTAHFKKNTEVGDISDHTLNFAADRKLLFKRFPWICLCLLKSKRNSFCVDIYVENDCGNRISDGNNF